MATRVQVILDEEEKELFRRRAELAGLSLSAWLRKAAREKLAFEERNPGIKTAEELRAFFSACDARERGKEPDWEEHLSVIEDSIRGGGPNT
ncbi:ribbon-helix-helix domain-containing protein [Acidobacteria bacterium AH-259-O06]|nr:ribbon-helix-helix domain-containing protein [Acidobacteria bacterium AH-259-O06]